MVVERGLAEGEMVVVEGFHKLTPGMKVRVSQPDAEAQDSITTTKNEVAGRKKMLPERRITRKENKR